MCKLSPRHCMLAALLTVLAVTQACAQNAAPSRAVIDPAPDVQLSYERLGPEDSATPPGRLDGSVATPAGTLRTTVRALPKEERSFQRGDTSFELKDRVLGGQLQLRELQAGGTAATWSVPFGAGLAAKTKGERTPIRNEQELQLQQQLDGAYSAQALLSRSRTATAQGSRWDLEFATVTGLSRWTAGIEAAESTYASPSGGLEPRTGVRLGTEWPLLPRSRMELRYSRQMPWYTQEPVSSVMVGTWFDLPLRASVATAVETDTDAHHRASLTLTVPLEPR